jgi:hypothetical protein
VWGTLLLSFLLVAGPGTDGEPKDGQPVILEITGTDTSWADAEYFGHAFLCITNGGGTDDQQQCLGFYPADERKGLALIGGPGVVEVESGKNPQRFNRVAEVFQTTITKAQVRQIHRKAKAWNLKHFRLTSNNCIDFVDSVAKSLGLRRPPRKDHQLPIDYVIELKKLNPERKGEPPMARKLQPNHK